MSGDELVMGDSVLGLSKLSIASCLATFGVVVVEVEVIGIVSCSRKGDDVLIAWVPPVFAKSGEVLLRSDSRFSRSGKAHYRNNVSTAYVLGLLNHSLTLNNVGATPFLGSIGKLM